MVDFFGNRAPPVPGSLLPSPLQSRRGGINPALLTAGLSLIDPNLGQSAQTLFAGQRQAQQDAIKMEILRREDMRAQQALALKQAAAQRQQQAQQALGNFIETQIPGSRQSSARALLQQALAGVEGSGDDLAKLLANEPIIQNDQFLSPDAVRRVVDEAGLLDVSINRRQAEEQARARDQLRVSQRQASVAERTASLAERKFTADERARGATIVGDKIVDLSDPANPKVTLDLKPAQSQKEQFDQEGKLRGEFTKQSGDFIKVRDAHARVTASAADPSPAGDLALIFNYMKILDPGSTVREGEFATAANAGAVSERVRSFYNRVVSGERLSDNQRVDFVNRAARLFEAQKALNDELKDDFIDLATRNNLRPENVIIGDQNTSGLPRVQTTNFGTQSITLPGGRVIVPGEVVEQDGQKFQNINGEMIEVQ